MGTGQGPVAQGGPCLPQPFWREVRNQGLDDCTKRRELLHTTAAEIENAVLAGIIAAPGADPADAQTAHFTFQTSRERGLRGRKAQGHGRLETRLDIQQMRQVAHAAGHGTVDAKLVDKHLRLRPGRHTPRGGTQTQDVVEGTGVAQRPHHVTAIRHRLHAQRQGDRRAAAGPPRRQRRIPGIAGETVQRVVGVGAETELRGIGLADDDGTCGPHPLDHQAILGRHTVGKERGAHGRRDPGGRGEILHRQRKAMHPAVMAACGQIGVGRRRIRHQHFLVPHGDDGIVDRVETPDAAQICPHDLDAGNLARRDGPGKRGPIGEDHVVRDCLRAAAADCAHCFRSPPETSLPSL